jgi:diadenylate cyclase
MLPLSTNYGLSKNLGMRHRAGVGLSERSDAVVIIVSEQTGTISVAVDGMLKRSLDAETLEMLLLSEVMTNYDYKDRAKKRKLKEAG